MEEKTTTTFRQGKTGETHLGLEETIQGNVNEDLSITNLLFRTLKILLLWIECLCPPLNLYVEALNPHCGGIWRWGLWEVITVRWGHEGRALVMGLYPDKRRCERACPLSLSFCVSTGRKGHVSRQQESGFVQARKRILTRNQVLPDLDFELSSL